MKVPLMVRALAAFLALPTLVAGGVPWLLSRIPAPVFLRSAYGFIPLAIGGGILIASVVSFYRRGQGTLAPWDPPKRLVVRGLYRFNRNPMYVGVAMILLGWALLTGSPWMYGYFLLVPVMFHLRVVLHEEREMERLFGREWEEYRRAVPRWGVRLAKRH